MPWWVPVVVGGCIVLCRPVIVAVAVCVHNGTNEDCASCYLEAVEGPSSEPPLPPDERDRRAAEYEAKHGKPK